MLAGRGARLLARCQQDYVGPDGVSRTRTGLVASLRAEPYEHGVVLPHERTHARPKEGRLRLLRATRTQLEPIFLLYEGDPLRPPAREPDLQSGGDKLWRVDDASELREHRAPDRGRSSPLRDRGRICTQDGRLALPDGRPRADGAGRADDLPDAPAGRARQRRPWHGDRGARRRAARRRRLPRRAVRSCSKRRRPRRRDRRADRAGRRDVHAAARRGRSRRWTAATPRRRFLLRPTRIEDVWAVARRGETMPQKSTYFYPEAHLAACSSTRLTDWLALCRAAVEDVRGVLAELPRARRARAGRRRRRRRRRDDGDRRGGRARDPRALRGGRRSDDRLRGGRRRVGDGATRRRDRSDRRLAEREARHPVLRALDRGRRRRRRWATSTSASSTTSAPGEEWTATPRRGAYARRPAARRRRCRRTRIEISRVRGDAHVLGRREGRGRRRSRATACGSWARSRSRSVTSPPGRIDAVCSLKPARAVDIAAAQLLVLERGLAIDLPERRRSLRRRSTSRRRSRVVAARNA